MNADGAAGRKARRPVRSCGVAAVTRAVRCRSYPFLMTTLRVAVGRGALGVVRVLREHRPQLVGGGAVREPSR